jgi:5-(carboxyamino)imidazole ribonucleotide synthase
MIRPAAAMAQILGDLWPEDTSSTGELRTPNWSAALRDPGVKLHLYGKEDARKGRKMGHLTATGATAEEAVQKVKAAREALKS